MLIVDLLIGAAVSLPFAWFAYRAGRVSRAGVLVGVAGGAITYAALLVGGLAVLGVALVLTIVSSRAVLLARGCPPEQRVPEHRGAANVLANCGVAIAGAIAHLIADMRADLTAVWFVAAIAAGASDTVASEIGKVFGGVARAFPTFSPVAPGTPGGVTVLGTLVGAGAAALIAAPAAALWLITWASLGLIVFATLCGAFVESLLATTLESRGLVGNHTLNVINTAVAAVVAAGLDLANK